MKIAKTTASLRAGYASWFKGRTWENKYPNLTDIFRDSANTGFVRYGVIGDGSCFFHSLLASEHPKLPREYSGYNALSTEQKREMISNFRRYLQREVNAAFEITHEITEDKDLDDLDDTDIKNLLLALKWEWINRYFDLQRGTDTEAVEFLESTLQNPECYVGHEAVALVYALLDIPTVLVVMDREYGRDYVECVGVIDVTQIPDDERVVVMVHINENHWEVAYEIDLHTNEFINKSHLGNSILLERMKEFCRQLVANPTKRWYCVNGECQEHEATDIDDLDAEILRQQDGDPKFFLSKEDCSEECLSPGCKRQKRGEDLEFTIEMAETLRPIYKKGYAFPQWAIDTLEDVFFDLAPRAHVYYSNGTLEDAQMLALQREPVNIGMWRGYDQKRMNEEFCWKTGYYGDFFEKNGKLAPNIAIYAPVLVRRGNKFKEIHLINSVGYAFDDEDQPDYQVLAGRPVEVFERYQGVFEKVFKCASDIGVTSVAMSLVGCGAFSELCDVDFVEETWIPSFAIVRSMYPNIDVVWMGGSRKFQPNIGLFPDCVEKVDTKNTLFVNAWDPWSIVGNGNAKDESLDGLVGRNTNAALLTWSMTNSYIYQEDSKYTEV